MISMGRDGERKSEYGKDAKQLFNKNDIYIRSLCFDFISFFHLHLLYLLHHLSIQNCKLSLAVKYNDETYLG